MGLLIDGAWSTEQSDARVKSGRFVRTTAGFRNWITPEGAPGPSGEGGFPAEPGRYHLYVSYACPWAHRTLIFRALKGLEDVISVSVVDPKMPDEHGWTFSGEDDGTRDAVNHTDYLWQVYAIADPAHTGRVTVPVLWDKQRRTIVSNESAEIIRMFNSAFNELTGNTLDFYPAPLRERIDTINERVYRDINNGVYKTGFATTQQAYDEAAAALFEALDWVEGILEENRFLTGDKLTEADIRLFATLVRFDAVYVGHFKCNLRRIADYPNLSRHLNEIYHWPSIAGTVHMDHIRMHYYWSHERINPYRIVPIGPELDFLD